jgi:hypothetical protein
VFSMVFPPLLFAMMFKIYSHMNLCQMCFLCCSFDSHVFVFTSLNSSIGRSPCDLKTMSNIFCGWMEARTLIQQQCGRWSQSCLCFKDCRKFNYLFLCFWLCLLFCRLLWSGLSELDSVMERDPYCSIDYFYGECESWFLETIGAKLSKEKVGCGQWKIIWSWLRRRNGKDFLLGVGEAKFQCFHLEIVEFV